MSPAHYAQAMAAAFPDYEAQLFSVLAFLGRYCHQPIGELMKMPSPDLMRLADATASLIEGESSAMQEAAASGGG